MVYQISDGYSKYVVANPYTKISSWTFLLRLLPEIKSFQKIDEFYSYLYLASTSPNLIKMGISRKPLHNIKSMNCATKKICANALIGIRPDDLKLRVIVPVKMKTCRVFNKIFEDQSLGYGWFSGRRISVFMGKLERSGIDFHKAL